MLDCRRRRCLWLPSSLLYAPDRCRRHCRCSTRLLLLLLLPLPLSSSMPFAAIVAGVTFVVAAAAVVASPDRCHRRCHRHHCCRCRNCEHFCRRHHCRHRRHRCCRRLLCCCRCCCRISRSLPSPLSSTSSLSLP